MSRVTQYFDEAQISPKARLAWKRCCPD